MCMFDSASCDPPVVYKKRNVKSARNPHKCVECGRVIERGEPYRYVFMIYEGDRINERTCAHCSVAQDWLVRECDGFLHECVLEDLHEHVIGVGHVFDVERGYGSGPARLVVGMRRKWRRFSGPGLMAVPALPQITAHRS